MQPRAYLGLALGWAFAQLSGVVNQYAAVTAFLDPSTLQVDDATPFAVGDRILVYQAKGAQIDQSNSPTYGDITSIGGAGLFELANIAAISGNTLTLNCPLTRPFDLSNPTGAATQVVKVAYSPGDVTITGPVTAMPWNGTKGGLVVIETDGTLTFSADIDVTGQGFRGGLRSINGGSSSACDAGTYYGAADDQAGRKGEGIANWPSMSHYAYRGKLANGGGGGNNHNTGGAGGGNYGTGGQGGWTTCGSRWWCSGTNVANSGYGLGGASLASYLSASNLRLFFGGGGGGGHHNNDQGGNGGPGGGIVLIRAAAISGGGRQIIARGAQGVQNLGSGCGQTNVSFAGNDGAGGGGAGGAVALFCNSYSGTLTIDVRGANGQNCSSHLCSCSPDHGPGGGGGGGYVAFSTGTTPAGVSLLTAGGQNGIELTPLNENQYGCSATGNCIPAGSDRYNRGATPGQAGGALYDLSWTPYAPCPTAEVQLHRWDIVFSPTGQVYHRWVLTTPMPLEGLYVQFVSKAQEVAVYPLPPHAEGEASHARMPGRYTASLYAQIGERTLLLGRKEVAWEQPFYRQGEGEVLLYAPEDVSYALYDGQGRVLFAGVLVGGVGQPLSLRGLPAGLYLLRVGERVYRLPVSP
ncbi:MAG: hypothetical protein KatS3mg025_0389 [Bacteroidia bacterium]|nr:MAG: hypothetical protein KatS3mg025_0389 [Bacteroidia bacterium]